MSSLRLESPADYDELLAAWCRERLGSAPEAILFRTGHLSLVTGLRLVDSREIVVKARAPAPRLVACFEVQTQLWRSGFPCPQPLVGPAPLGDLAATAEAFVPGGLIIAGGPDAARLSAAALARLTALAPAVSSVSTLEPPPPWVRWDHELRDVWPPHDDRDIDLNEYPEPGWLTDVAARARRRLLASHLPPIVSHADWIADNLRWRGGRLYVVHDWDSVAALPEPAIAGAAAGIYLAKGVLAMSDLPQTEAFLNAYESARGVPFTVDERQVCWAAALWVNAYDAKKQSVDGGGAVLDRLAVEAPERLRRAGA